jgi:hypothetical protein
MSTNILSTCGTRNGETTSKPSRAKLIGHENLFFTLDFFFYLILCLQVFTIPTETIALFPQSSGLIVTN